MTKVFLTIALLFAAFFTSPASAQQTAWVQIESQPDLMSAQTRAFLEDYYQHEPKALTELTGIDFSAWTRANPPVSPASTPHA